MAQFIPVPEVVLAQFIHDFRGEQMINDVHFWRPDGIITNDIIEDLAIQLRNIWGANMMPLMSNDCTLTRVRCYDLTLADGVFAEAAGPIVGTAGDASPNSVCIAIKKSTGARGASQRGRIFWGAIPSAQVEENNLTEAYSGQVLSAFNTNMAGLDAPVVGWQSVVVSTVHLGQPRAVGTFLAIREWLMTDLIVDSYRTRLPNHRRRKRKVVPGA